MGPRVVTVCAGAWLFCSVFLWEHRPAQFHNAWLTAAVIVTTALAALDGRPLYRYASFAAALWLMSSVVVFAPYSLTTGLNHVGTGIVVALSSLIPSTTPARGRRPARRRATNRALPSAGTPGGRPASAF